MNATLVTDAVVLTSMPKGQRLTTQQIVDSVNKRFPNAVFGKSGATSTIYRRLTMLNTLGKVRKAGRVPGKAAVLWAREFG